MVLSCLQEMRWFEGGYVARPKIGIHACRNALRTTLLQLQISVHHRCSFFDRVILAWSCQELKVHNFTLLGKRTKERLLSPSELRMFCARITMLAILME